MAKATRKVRTNPTPVATAPRFIATQLVLGALGGAAVLTVVLYVRRNATDGNGAPYAWNPFAPPDTRPGMAPAPPICIDNCGPMRETPTGTPPPQPATPPPATIRTNALLSRNVTGGLMLVRDMTPTGTGGTPLAPGARRDLLR